MKAFVSVECNKCQREIKQIEAVYCSGCVDFKDKIIHRQDEYIKALENKIKRLEGGETNE